MPVQPSRPTSNIMGWYRKGDPSNTLLESKWVGPNPWGELANPPSYYLEERLKLLRAIEQADPEHAAWAYAQQQKLLGHTTSTKTKTVRAAYDPNRLLPLEVSDDPHISAVRRATTKTTPPRVSSSTPKATPPKAVKPATTQSASHAINEGLESLGKGFGETFNKIPKKWKIGGAIGIGAALTYWLFSDSNSKRSRQGSPRARGYGWQPTDPRINHGAYASRTQLNYNYSMSGIA